jgi:hypothetical protein
MRKLNFIPAHPFYCPFTICKMVPSLPIYFPPRNILLAFLLVCIPSLLFSQQNHGISGRISDINNHHLENVKVTLLNTDSIVLKSTFTNHEGFYNINYEENDTVLLKAEKQGFVTTIKLILSHTTFDFVMFGNILLNLNEVSVVAKKQLIEYKPDRVVFNVENSITATGGNALDAIKRAPGVLYAHNEISIAGKSSLSVMINGRLQQLSGDDLNQLLQSIPADHISKIEIITSPSSRYDAEGNAGIINLVMKKNKQAGFKGSVTTTYEYNAPLSLPAANTTLTYKKDNLNVYGTLNGGKQGYPYKSYTDSYYPNNHWHQQTNYPFNQNYSRFQFGGDYVIRSSSTIGFMASVANSKLNNDEHITARGYGISSQSDSIVGTTGKTTDSYPVKFSSNVNYEYRFDSTGKKLSIDVDYYNQKGERHRDVVMTEGTIQNALTKQTESLVIGKLFTTIMAAKIDIDLPLKKIRFIFGGKVSGSQNDMDNLYFTKTGADYINDTGRSNQFNYKEGIQAAYINVTNSWNKFNFNAGLRAEHTHGIGESVTLVQSNVYNYINLFPSCFVQYSINKNHILNVSVARRINRPNYNFLNPFRFYYSINTYSQGNIYLQPSFNNTTQFNYIYKSNLNIKLMYNAISNYFDRVYSLDTTLHTNALSRKNIGDKNVMEAFVSGSATPAEWCELSGSINGGYSRFVSNDLRSQKQYSGFNWWIEITSIYYLNNKKTLSAELGGYYYSGRQRDVVYWAPMSAVNSGIRYSMFNKNLLVSFFADDIFAKSYWLQMNQLNKTVEYSYDGHSYRISLTYRFGNKNIKNRQINSTEEIQRTN